MYISHGPKVREIVPSAETEDISPLAKVATFAPSKKPMVNINSGLQRTNSVIKHKTSEDDRDSKL